MAEYYGKGFTFVTPGTQNTSVPPEHLELVVERFNSGLDMFTGKPLTGQSLIEWQLAFANPDYDLVRPEVDEVHAVKMAEFLAQLK